MSIRLIEQVWGLKLNNEGERLVLLALADNANDEGTHCFPSQRRIAWKTDLSVSAVKAIINRLEIRGLVETLNKGNQYRPTNYALHLEKGEIKEAFVASSWGGDRNDPTAYATGKALEREQAYRDTAGKVKGQLDNLQSESPAEERFDHRSEGLVRESEGLVQGSEGLGTTHKPSVEPSVQPETLTVAVPDMAGKGSDKPSYSLNQTDTSREGQIQNLREVPSRGVKKILLTINGCRCKAFGEKAKRIPLCANICETVLVLLINEQGEKEKGRDEREFSWCCSFPWGFGWRGTERRRAWLAAAECSGSQSGHRFGAGLAA